MAIAIIDTKQRETDFVWRESAWLGWIGTYLNQVCEYNTIGALTDRQLWI